METYGDDPCLEFIPKLSGGAKDIDEKTHRLAAMMHKAIAIIQFKEEAVIIERHPEWKMSDRALFNNIDYKKGEITIDGVAYPLKSNMFPTIDPKHPNKLTEEEELLMNKLVHSFLISEKLQKHIRLLLQHGSMYAVYNNNLLFHASLPLNDDGSLKEVEVLSGQYYKGKELMETIEMLVRTAFQADADALPTISYIYGVVLIAHCSINLRWQHLKDISLKIKKRTKKRRETISSCVNRKRLSTKY